MTKEQFLTQGINNWLTIGLGLPALAYVILALSTSVLSENTSLIGLSIIGVMY